MGAAGNGESEDELLGTEEAAFKEEQEEKKREEEKRKREEEKRKREEEITKIKTDFDSKFEILNTKLQKNSYNIKENTNQMADLREESKGDNLTETQIKEYQKQLEASFAGYGNLMSESDINMPKFTAIYTPKEYRIKREKKVFFGKKGKDFMITILG